MTRTAAELRDLITDTLRPLAPDTLGVAVSGGSDSMALLVLLHDWMQQGGPALKAVTVDHGLRERSAEEAVYVGEVCSRLGIPHSILEWQEWDGQGNLPDQARRARYAMMAGWAGASGLSHVAVGHTADDQAETFVMRLAREAGVDGLSAMAESWWLGTVTFCRPVLGATRAELRTVLEERGIAWIDDPTNEDEQFERVRARKVLAALAELGITARGLSRVAHHVASMRDTLYWYVKLAVHNIAALQSGDVLIDRAGFGGLPPEVARRLLQEALKWVSGAEYGPRGRALDALMAAVGDATGMTLHGCLITVEDDHLRIAREANAVADLRVPVGAVWDGRWLIEGPDTEGAEVAALGDRGLRACPDWRETGLPGASLRASPAVWRGGQLLAAPLAGMANGWSVTLQHDENHVFAALLSH